MKTWDSSFNYSSYLSRQVGSFAEFQSRFQMFRFPYDHIVYHAAGVGGCVVCLAALPLTMVIDAISGIAQAVFILLNERTTRGCSRVLMDKCVISPLQQGIYALTNLFGAVFVMASAVKNAVSLSELVAAVGVGMIVVAPFSLNFTKEFVEEFFADRRFSIFTKQSALKMVENRVFVESKI